MSIKPTFTEALANADNGTTALFEKDGTIYQITKVGQASLSQPQPEVTCSRPISQPKDDDLIYGLLHIFCFMFK